jgi:hypothetical protein
MILADGALSHRNDWWCCPNPSTAGERPSGRRVAHLRQARRGSTMTVP